MDKWSNLESNQKDASPFNWTRQRAFAWWWDHGWTQLFLLDYCRLMSIGRGLVSNKLTYLSFSCQLAITFSEVSAGRSFAFFADNHLSVFHLCDCTRLLLDSFQHWRGHLSPSCFTMSPSTGICSCWGRHSSNWPVISTDTHCNCHYNALSPNRAIWVRSSVSFWPDDSTLLMWQSSACSWTTSQVNCQESSRLSTFQLTMMR